MAQPDPIPSAAGRPVPLPGVAAVALYMLVLSAVVAFGVLGRHLPPLLLIASLLFAVGGLGLVRLFRWGWALATAATGLLVAYGSWLFFSRRQGPAAILMILNLIFFAYLIRPAVSRSMR
jgi:hypothetical protein